MYVGAKLQNNPGKMLFAFKFTESGERFQEAVMRATITYIRVCDAKAGLAQTFFELSKLPCTDVNNSSNLKHKQSKH